MPAIVTYYTDPACSWSWGSEPKLRRLMWEFGDELRFTWVMGGLARSYGTGYRDSESGVGSGPDCFGDLMAEWLETAAGSGMPIDARIWSQNPIASTYPACQAVKAATEQGAGAAYRYLRRLREGLMTERKKLDHAEALIGEARRSGLTDQRLGVIELLSLRHQPLPQPAQVPVRGAGSLLSRGLHRLAGGIGRGDRVLAPDPGVDRHPGSGGGLEPLCHQIPEAVRSRAHARLRIAVAGSVGARQPAHDPGETQLVAELPHEPAKLGLGTPGPRAGGVRVIGDDCGHWRAGNPAVSGGLG